jgi:hypothetical protein
MYFHKGNAKLFVVLMMAWVVGKILTNSCPCFHTLNIYSILVLELFIVVLVYTLFKIIFFELFYWIKFIVHSLFFK